MCERWLKMFHEDNNMWIIINNNKCRSFFHLNCQNWNRLVLVWRFPVSEWSFRKEKKKNNLVYRFSKLEPSASQTLWETLGAVPGVQGDRPSGGVGVPLVCRLTAGLLDEPSNADTQPRWPAPHCAWTLTNLPTGLIHTPVVLKSAGPAPASFQLHTINSDIWSSNDTSGAGE